MSNPSVGDKARYAAERVMEPILRRWFALDLDPVDVERNAENAAVDLSWALEDAGLLADCDSLLTEIAALHAEIGVQVRANARLNAMLARFEEPDGPDAINEASEWGPL